MSTSTAPLNSWANFWVMAPMLLRNTGRCAILACILITATLLTGCVLSRTFSFQKQFCDLESNFTLVPGDQPRLLLHKPVLQDQDVEWLTGAIPTPVYTADLDLENQVLESYVIEKVMRVPDPNTDLELQLLYQRQDKIFELAEIRFDDKIGPFIDPQLFESGSLQTAAATVCEAGLGLALSRIEIPLSQEDMALLPNLPEVLDIFGPPSETLVPGEVLVFEYRLKTTFPPERDRPAKKARVVVTFDPETQAPLKLEASYWRYQVNADFEARKLVFEINL